MSDTGMQVAKANVGIFPVLNGVRAAIEKELQASGKAGQKAFGKAFSGGKLGRDSGRDVVKAFDAATESLGEQTFKSLSQDAAKASAALSKAREQQRSTAAQTRIAEQKLAEAIERYGEGTSQAMQAQERLTSAQRKSEQASDDLAAAQERLEKARKAVFEALPTSGKTGEEWLKRQTETLTAQAVTARKRLEEADQSVAKAEQRLADAMGAGESSAKKVASAQAALEAAKTRQRNASERLASTERELDRVQNASKQGTDQMADAMKNGANASDLLKKGMDAVSSAAGGVKAKYDDATKGIKDFALGAAGIAGIGATIGTAIQSGLEQANLEGTLMAALGDETAAKQAGVAIGTVYAEGWGESLDQVKEAALQAKQTIRDIDDEDLTKVTRNALVLADVFGADISESVRGTNALMEGFGLSATEASDLMAAGMQRGLNYTDELGDNLAEYSVRWGEAGMSASQYFSLLQAGTDNGAYNLDKVGDYLNEFLTSLSDGRMEESIGRFSDGTQRIFDNFKQGKATAEEVLNAVIGDLKNMSTEQERATAASELWSSLGEDNAMGMILALGDVEDSYKDVAGAADDMAENNESIQQSWERITRSIMQNIGQKLAPMLQDLADTIDEKGPAIAKTVENIAGVVITVVDAFTKLPGPVQIGIGALALFGGKIPGIVSGVKTLGSGVKAAAGLFKSFGGASKTAGSSVSALASNSGKAASGIGGVASGIGGLGAIINPVTLGITAIGTGLKIWSDHSRMVEERVQALTGALSQGQQGLDQYLQTAVTTGENLNWGWWQKAGTGCETFNELLGKANLTVGDFKAAITGSKEGVEAYTASLDASLESGEITKAQYEELIAKCEEQANAYSEAQWQMNQMAGTATHLSQMQSQLSSSMSTLTTSIQANGLTMDMNTQAGQQNRAAMQSIADQALVTAQAMLADGAANDTMAQSSQNARNTIYEAREALVQAAQQCGMSEQAANEYADSLGLIPSNVGTVITENANMTRGEVEAYLQALGWTPSQISTWFSENADSTKWNVQSLSNEIKNVPKQAKTEIVAEDHASGVLSNVWNWIKAIPSRVTTWVSGIFKADGGEVRRSLGGVVTRANGGPIQRFAAGGGPSGYVTGPGTTTSDSIPTLLSNKEFVIRASSARRLGIDNLRYMNDTGRYPTGAFDMKAFAEAIASVLVDAVTNSGIGTRVVQNIHYPAVAPSVLSINERLDLAAMPKW